MSTPAPASKDFSAPGPTPFEPHTFPKDLIAAQHRAAELYAQLHTLQASLPWSREPHPGWPEETEREGRARDARLDGRRGRRVRPTVRDAARGDSRRTVPLVVGALRPGGIKGADLVAARQALKHAKGAVPLCQDDVEQTA